MLTAVLDLPAFAEQVRVEGWAVTPPLFSSEFLDRLTNEVGAVDDRTSNRGGTRSLLELAAVRELAKSDAIHKLAAAVLGDNCFPVRGILFDKTPSANWKVTWHQDLTIAVRNCEVIDGFGPWSVKEGVVHVQPPTEILERMLAIRVHLDQCGSENGPVRVIPRSHRFGRLSGTDIDAWKANEDATDCIAARGAVLAFSPLLLHSSSPARRPEHRRGIHLEFAAAVLPPALQWHYATENHLAPSA